MRFGYDKGLLELAPALVAGVLWVRGIDNTRTVPEIQEDLEAATTRAAERYPENADIARAPAVAAWRAVYSLLGLTPNRYPCAAESLIRRAVSGQPAPNISPLVDLCNAASLDHAIPVAPFELRLVEGDCIVRLATGDELFRTIGGSEVHPIPAGEAIYGDATNEVLSRRWNWRQTGKGAIQPSTTEALITTEAVHSDGRATVESVIDWLVTRIERRLGGELETDILTPQHPVSTRTLPNEDRQACG